jgi:hypothetical protein
VRVRPSPRNLASSSGLMRYSVRAVCLEIKWDTSEAVSPPLRLVSRYVRSCGSGRSV